MRVEECFFRSELGKTFLQVFLVESVRSQFHMRESSVAGFVEAVGVLVCALEKQKARRQEKLLSRFFFQLSPQLLALNGHSRVQQVASVGVSEDSVYVVRAGICISDSVSVED